MTDFRVPLGVKAKDRISGYEGTVMSRTQYLTGCNRICIQKEGVQADGKLFEPNYFDEPYVEVTSTDTVTPVTPRGKDDGGPMPAPNRGR